VAHGAGGGLVGEFARVVQLGQGHPADDVLRRVPEQPLGAKVEHLDAAGGIGGDDALRGMGKDAALHVLLAAPAGHVGQDHAEAGAILGRVEAEMQPPRGLALAADRVFKFA
jgi:hypothetical protein